MNKINIALWYLMMAPFLMLLCAGLIVVAAIYTLVVLFREEMEQRHNYTALHQDIDIFLAGERAQQQ